MDTEKKTCKDLVQDKWKEREDHIGRLMDIVQDDNEFVEVKEAADEELMDMPLQISEFKVVKILLSTGGPADWIEVEIDDANEVNSMSYHYADWFDHAEIKFHDKSYMWEYVAQILTAHYNY